MHNWKISEHLQEVMKKLSKKDKPLYEHLVKKIDEIINCEDVEHYKNLRYNMKDSTDIVNFDDFDHHDIIYKN